MHIQLQCECGKDVSVTEAAAGASLPCDCGRTIKVPSLRDLWQLAGAEDGNNPAEETSVTVPPPAPDLPIPVRPSPVQDALKEVIDPTPVSLRTEYRTLRSRPRPVMAALTADALWIQDTWQLRQVPLPAVAGVEALRNGQELALTLGPEGSAERLRLTFADAVEGRRWLKELEARRQQLPPDTPPGDRPVPEGVALVARAPDVPHVALGRVGFTGLTTRTADRGLQLRAGIRGADAVIGVERRKCPELGWGARHVTGLAVRAEDAAGRQRLRQCWYAEEVGGQVRRMLLLLAVQAALLFVLAVFCAGLTSFNAPTGETPLQALSSAGLGLGLLYAWPFALLALLWVLRWPLLLRSAGLGVLVGTTGRGLTVALAHLLAVQAAGATPAGGKVWLLADPFDWALMIAGAVLWVRAWRLAGDAPDMLPQAVQAVWAARRPWARALLALTAAYALAVLGFVGVSRYQTSAYLLQPGVDARREHEALRAFNQGVAHMRQNDLGAAERSFQGSLRLWEELTARPAVPPVYRANLALTLYNLGCVSHRQGRLDEAEAYYARAVARGEELAGDAQADQDLQEGLAEARRLLAELRGDKTAQDLDEKDRRAVRKYEEAQVKAQQGTAEAEGLYREAITLSEEILPQVTTPEARRILVTRLATAYLMLGELQQQQGKRSEAEASLKKGIDYGEKALTLDPDRPLIKHNLELARQMLERQREQAHQEEIDKLYAAERYADAIDVHARGIEEQEERVRSDKDREAAVRRLAYRLDRFAWLLAHCPDGRVRDTKAAVKRARRATELQPDVADYWYTLAMVQYRNGDWRDSLASLERVKAGQGAITAADWLLVAMNRHQLKQRDEARAALRKAAEWMDEQKRKAEDDALLRFQLETMRPMIEALRREAEALIEAKDPAGVGVG
jgi:tetratricopeptide (TPR) repeat protein